MSGVLVGNPGSVPEMTYVAAALGKAGMLDRYVIPIAATRQLDGAAGRLPIAGERAQRELRRRAVPPGVPDERVERVATFSELAFVAASRARVPRPAAEFLLHRRDRRFDAGLAARLQASHDAVVATHGAALSTMRRARRLGVGSFLEYPIAHHRYAARLLQEEAVRQPDYAPTLQFHQLPAWQQQRLEAEIDSAGTIFALSSFQARTFAESGVPEDKVVVTPLGVDLELFQPLRASGRDRFRVVFVGQVTQRKGISYLLEGFRNAAIPGAELLLVGQVVGTDRPWRGQPGVRHHPHVPRRELPRVYAGADVFVLPSLIEGFGLTALEAMACALPVVVSENTFGSDVIDDGESGYVIPIRDADAVASRLRQLYEHPAERERMGVNARQAAERFSWDAYGERVVSAVGGRCPVASRP
jgi:glycosyltransferase involved in cell wall biosynthesis